MKLPSLLVTEKEVGGEGSVVFLYSAVRPVWIVKGPVPEVSEVMLIVCGVPLATVPLQLPSAPFVQLEPGFQSALIVGGS